MILDMYLLKDKNHENYLPRFELFWITTNHGILLYSMVCQTHWYVHQIFKPSGTNLPSTTTYLYLMIPNGDDFVPHDLVFLFMFLWGRSRYLISKALLIMKIGSILARFSFGVGTSSFNTYFFLCSPKRSTNWSCCWCAIFDM